MHDGWISLNTLFAPSSPALNSHSLLSLYVGTTPLSLLG
jgi:hypothetical protein